MTLIIGVKCSDGIVVGSDGAATLGFMGTHTVRQPIRKLSFIDGRVVVGVSGPAGLAQRIVWEIESLWKAGECSGCDRMEAVVKIRKKMFEHIEVELQVASRTRPILGSAALTPALTSTIVAAEFDGLPFLVEFDQQGTPEFIPDELPFTAIGGGKSIADPFLGFIRRVLWSENTPSLRQGIFTTVWTLQHAISLSPGGVAEPIEIVTLQNTEQGWMIRNIGTEEIGEHLEAIEGAERALKSYMSIERGPGDSPIEPPPEP